MKGFKVAIEYEGKTGWVTYNEKKRTFKVEHPNERVVKKVTRYLMTARAFRIPESDQIDDYRVEETLPGKTKMHAQLSLSSMHGKTGVWVDWDKQESFPSSGA